MGRKVGTMLKVSYRVMVAELTVEGKDKEKFPSHSEVIEVESVDNLLKAIHQRWGVNSETVIFVWRNNLEA